MVSRRVIRAVTPPTSQNLADTRHSRFTALRSLHDSIAESICCWVYSRLPNMKNRWSIAAALLFALMLAPTALRASTAPMRAPSCHVSKAQFHSDRPGRLTGRSLVQLLASRPGQHTPAPRLHRTRGKKINIQGSTILALQCFTATRFVAADASSGLQIIDGPNPSRGPPSQHPL